MTSSFLSLYFFSFSADLLNLSVSSCNFFLSVVLKDILYISLVLLFCLILFRLPLNKPVTRKWCLFVLNMKHYVTFMTTITVIINCLSSSLFLSLQPMTVNSTIKVKQFLQASHKLPHFFILSLCMNLMQGAEC